MTLADRDCHACTSMGTPELLAPKAIIRRELAAIWVRSRELTNGAIVWAHRGPLVEDVWLTGECADLARELWRGQDVTAVVRKNGGALQIRRARVLAASGAAGSVRLWLSAEDTQHVVVRWWEPSATPTPD